MWHLYCKIIKRHSIKINKEKKIQNIVGNTLFYPDRDDINEQQINYGQKNGECLKALIGLKSRHFHVQMISTLFYLTNMVEINTSQRVNNFNRTYIFCVPITMTLVNTFHSYGLNDFHHHANIHQFE